MIEALRTPDDRFADLPAFPYRPRYVEDLAGYEGLRAAYVDEGPPDAAVTFLCLHGEPSWSFLYRKMLPVFLEAGARVVAPDLLGFGRSDKPVDDAIYTFGFHRNFLLRLTERLDLSNIVLAVQDWGGLLGLTLPVDAGFRARLKGLLVMNTALAIGEPAGPGFDAWRAYAAANPDLDVQGLMRRASAILSPQEVAAYGAPFPDIRYKAGPRSFPPTRDDLARHGRGRRVEGRAEVLVGRLGWSEFYGLRRRGHRLPARPHGSASGQDPRLSAGARDSGGGTLRSGMG
jgi:pimeloyl-ACP methyl ester carboxylesterase